MKNIGLNILALLVIAGSGVLIAWIVLQMFLQGV